MRSSSPDQRVRLISQGYDTWKVQVLFTNRDLSAVEISERLREVKRELAKQFGVPDALLEYSRLYSKQQTRSGLLVQMQIIKQSLPCGAPVFRSKPLRAEDGTMFSDMIIEADLWPYDEFEHPLTRLFVEARLKGQGFDLGCVNWDSVVAAVETMSETAQPVKGLEIGRGTIPGLGKSSRITYGIRHDQEALLPSAWMGVRPVRKGDFLVEVSLPSGGHQWGKNVFGRELEPRQGLQTRLEAGDGTQLRLRDTQLIAQQDGLLIFERAGRDKRDCDTPTMPLARLTGRVVPVRTLEQSDPYQIELSEAAIILGVVNSGSRIRSTSALFVAGDVAEGTEIECTTSLRIAGSVRGARIRASKHCCVGGFVADSQLECGLTLQTDAGVLNSTLRATDVIGREIRGSTVEALRQTSFDKIDEGGGGATAIRINLRRFLENQQVAGREALEDLRNALAQIQDIFGPEITQQVSEGTAQRMLLRWLRRQKGTGAGNYTHVEVQEFRSVLEMVPVIREQLAAMGMELRDITSQLSKCDQVNQT